MRNREIRNLLTLLGAAIICAGLLTWGFLYYYGPSGRYLAGKTLLDPAIIDQVRYQDQHIPTGKKIDFEFDRIELSYFDLEKKQMKKVSFSIENYEIFYKRVASLKSLENIDGNIQNLFRLAPPALLTIWMHPQQGKWEGASQVFQVVQLIPEGDFRVQLHGTNGEEWAYFYLAGIYQEMISLIK